MMFFASMTLVMTIAGAFQLGQGGTGYVGAKLTADLSAAATTLNVSNTNGFPDVGFVTIGAEEIRYTKKTATTFTGIAAQALQRGWDDTTAVVHSKGAGVRNPESALINNAMDVEMANISDSAGVMRFFTVSRAAMKLLGTFFTQPFQLPADLFIITLLWTLMVVLFFVFLGLTLTGGRRV
jgi:hypothetical protein